ncbi:hypothetical protein [Mesobacillus subterraneus]|uniref:Uncharacterized protein n=1 Tax=Mesobacillus subterraneus TaxID=285983 RepID=A0A3R9F4R4_9BACI|nr:hypothetical protein [Mesobacillus subterraneus]RSD29003.1 hypothetical protein EJA10_02530 [Mesobacillus subterraneus]
MKKYKHALISLMLLVICLITWQVTGSAAEKTAEMDQVTSYALYSFLGTLTFLVSTVILFLNILLKRVKGSKPYS